MSDPAHVVALAAGGLFAGVLLYTTAVAHPVRLSMGADFALANFLASVPRSDKMQPLLHVICVLATAAWVVPNPTPVGIAALVAMAPVLPLSVALILPLNAQLKASPAPEDVMPLLDEWGRLHRLRSLCGIVAFLLLAAG